MPVDKKSSLHIIGDGGLLSLPRDWLKRCLQGGPGAAIATNTCSVSVVGDTANSELCSTSAPKDSSKLTGKTSNIIMAPVSTADSMREDKDRMNISKPRTGELFL